MALSTSFYHRDYFNEIRLNATTTWEVAHPLIFRQLVSQRPKQWHSFPFADGLRSTCLTVQTPLGKADVWVFCEFPEMFQIPLNGHRRQLWEWWLKWSQTPLSIMCPIFKNKDLPIQGYHSWNIRSTPVPIDNVWGAYPNGHLLDSFLFSGCFTVASGQTLAIALHRDGRLSAYILLYLVRKWRRYYRTAFATATTDTDLREDERWMMVFQTNNIQLIQYVRTNTLVGDHPALYATYGNTDPMVLTELFQQLSIKVPVISHFIEYDHTPEPTLRSAVYQSFYSKVTRSSSAWAIQWRSMKPFMQDMSIRRFRYASFYQQPTHVYPPPGNDFFDHLHTMFRATDSDHGDWISFIRFLQSEYNITNNRMTYYLFSATFRCRATQSQLYTYWSFVQSFLFHTVDEWMTWVCNLVVFYHNRTRDALPWRFFHWLFSEFSIYPTCLFQPYPVQLEGVLYQQSLYDYLNLYKENPPATQIPYLYKDLVLRPRLQARLRVLYAFRRTLPAGVSDVLLAYISTPTHRDLLWQ
jgi:hypothetical protein